MITAECGGCDNNVLHLLEEETCAMNYNISITGIDGETHVQMQTPRADSALEFLQKHDHEGSSVYLRIDADDSDDVYRLLKDQSETPSST